MSQADTYYRVLRACRQLMAADRDCESLCKALTAASGGQDCISVRQFVCEVDEEWVDAVERGLVFVGKALREERQFIESRGEVVEIEKVKHVSKESVVHLARHSEMITRESDSGAVIPDKLYTVERLNDYTVYENRFLYLLLCCLRDFVSVRYTDILALSGRYEGRLETDREYRARGRSLRFRLSLEDNAEDDARLQAQNPCAPVLDRLDLILKAVLAYLQNPIMEACAKAAMIRPPITKTNVLRMNNNFRGAVELYEYIVAYNRDGYTVKPVERTLSPLPDEAGTGISEAELLTAFLTYSYGLGLQETVRRDCEAEDERRRQSELAQRQEQLGRLKRRLANAEISVEDYIAELEEQNRQLEKQAFRVPLLTREKQELESRADALTEESNALRREITAVSAAYERESDSLRAAYEQRLADGEMRAAEAVSELKQAHEAETAALRTDCEEKVSALIAAQEAETAAREAQLASLRQSLTGTEAALAEKTAACDSLTAENTVLTDKLTVTEARLLAVRSQTGQLGADETHTAEDDFNRLETEYEALRKYYKDEWRAAKRGIRRRYLNAESLKKQGPDGE